MKSTRKATPVIVTATLLTSVIHATTKPLQTEESAPNVSTATIITRVKSKFLSLGALHRVDLHPYEIKRRLNNALVECYTDVDVGTLYYAVRQLARSGDIASRRSERVARGGERTVYRITPKGKKRFQELLLERFREEGSVAQTIYPALLFLHLAHLPAVAGLLRERLQQIESDLAKVRAVKDQLGAVL